MNTTPSNRQSSDGGDRPAILIFGASARAAAESACRAGMEPIAADLFADVDLCEVAEVLPLREYPADFVRVAKRPRPCPWMYTGGLENYAEIVSEVSADRPLWGNPGCVLQRVRDPALVYETLRHAGLPAAEIRPANRPPPPRGDWLLKPTGGAGGGGITVWNEAANGHATLERPHVFQQRLNGTPISAVFLATRNRGHLIGVTRQFVGTKSLAAAPFSYCGSLGPCRFSEAQTAEIAMIGRTLADVFDLRGLFGVDLICDGETSTPVEVNPRYVASVEILEQVFDVSLLDWHRRACESYASESAAALVDEAVISRLHKAHAEQYRHAGKAILYARDDLLCPPLKTIRQSLFDNGCRLADIPQPGTRIARGRPICTVLTTGGDDGECLRRLGRTLRRVGRHASIAGYS